MSRKEQTEKRVKTTVKWGEIYYCDLGEGQGSEQRGVRPVLIVQSNRLNQNSPTVVVAAITSTLKKELLGSHVVLGKRFGLTASSMVMLEQVKTVDIKARLGNYVGSITDAKVVEQIREAQKYLHGLPVKPPKKRMCRLIHLCPRCRTKMFKDPHSIIIRFDSLKEENQLCEMCQQDYGYEYLLRRTEHSPQFQESEV